MKRHIFFVLLIVLLSATSAFSAKIPNVVVFPLKPTGVSASTADLATDRIRVLLGSSGRVRVLERNQIDAILVTIGKNLDECTEDGCGIQIGRQLDADKIITGSVTKVGNNTTISVSILDVETTVRQASAYKDIPNIAEDQVITYMQAVANDLLLKLPLIGVIQEVNGDRMMVDLGSSNGITIGMELVVENVREIQDASTGEMRLVPEEIGTITVVKLAGTDWAQCTPKPGSEKITVGMTVRPALIVPVLQPVQPTSPTPQPGTSVKAKRKK